MGFGKMHEAFRRYVVLLILFLISLIFYCFYIFREPLVYGIDGPYYLVQILYIEKYGTMYYGDPPLTFYILYAFYKLLGDPTLAVKIGIMLFTSLTAIPLYLYFYNTTGRAEVGFFASIAYLFSPHVIRLMGDFVKNTFGLFFLTCYIYFFTKAYGSRSNRLYVVLALFFMVLTFTSHILAFGILMLYTILYPTTLLVLKIGRNRRTIYVAMLFIFSMIILSVVSYILSPFYFSDLNRIISYIRGIMHLHEYSTRPTVGSSPISLFAWPILTYLLTPFMSIASLTVLMIYWFLRGSIKPLALSSYIILLILLNPLSPSGVFFRFLLASILPLSYAIGYLVSEYAAKYRAIILALLIISLTILLATQTASTWGPVITSKEYDELLEAIKHIKEENAVIKTVGMIRYWVEYVVGDPNKVLKGPMPRNLKEPIYIIIFKERKPLPKLRPHEIIVYDGRFVQLRKIMPPRCAARLK